VANSSRRPHRRLVLDVDVLLERREQAEAIVAELRGWLAAYPLVRQDLPQRVAFTALIEGAWRLRVECALEGDLEAFQTLRQDVLLEVNAVLIRQGAALSGPMESSDVRSTPGGGGRP
jgi:hypothetical protein